MTTVIEIHLFEKYENYIKDITADHNYTDPHFLYCSDNLYGALKKENHKAYIILQNEEVVGLFVWLIVPEENYIEMIIGLTRLEIAFEEMLSFIEEEYPHFQMDFVINPKNYAIRYVLEERQAAFETEQQKMLWVREVSLETKFQVELITPEYEEQYISLHRGDTYWTAEKVLHAKDRFRVYVAIRDKKIIGYLDVTYCYDENEPYDLWVKEEYANMGYEQALLQIAVEQNKPNGMMVLVDVDAYKEINIYEAVGFEVVEGQNSVYATYHS